MPLSMYQASIPLFLRGMRNLSAVLKKGEAHDGSGAFVEARLAPDMLTLAGQIQRVSDTAKGAAGRLAGIETPSMPDEEKTFADLQARLDKTIAFLESVKPAQVDGSEAKPITLKAGKQEIKFTGETYLTNFAIPNFYFHVTTAYDILRHKGVPLGKMDYLAGAGA
jgi:hypothetical protein